MTMEVAALWIYRSITARKDQTEIMLSISSQVNRVSHSEYCMYIFVAVYNTLQTHFVSLKVLPIPHVFFLFFLGICWSCLWCSNVGIDPLWSSFSWICRVFIRSEHVIYTTSACTKWRNLKMVMQYPSVGDTDGPASCKAEIASWSTIARHSQNQLRCTIQQRRV